MVAHTGREAAGKFFVLSPGRVGERFLAARERIEVFDRGGKLAGRGVEPQSGNLVVEMPRGADARPEDFAAEVILEHKGGDTALPARRRPGDHNEDVSVDQNAYGVTIWEEIEKRTGRSAMLGAVYATLDRLESKRYISSRRGDPTPERGGRAKKFFKITARGARALDRSRKILDCMWAGVDPLLGEP